jgi:hypothetical protein
VVLNLGFDTISPLAGERTMKILPVLLVGLLLAGCGERAVQQFSPPITADVIAEEAPSPAVAIGLPSSELPANTPGPMLAYSYQYGISVAPAQLRSLVAKHEAQCTAAGIGQCQVIQSSTTENDGQSWLYGNLQLRATPAWLSDFRERLSTDANAAGGRLLESSVTSEDLSRQIVYTEATLRAKITLRDRLQQLLATRPGNLADLLAAERALAAVQSELDSTQSMLTMMRARVTMSAVQIRYQSTSDALSNSAGAPIRRAFNSAARLFSESLSTLIVVVVMIAPWIPALWLLYWAARRWLFRKRAKAAATPANN